MTQNTTLSASQPSSFFVPKWEELNQTALQIKTFLNSLDKAKIGGGLVYYDESAFCLNPRSNWSNSHKIQRLVSATTKGSTFEDLQKAFNLHLKAKIAFLSKEIICFLPHTAKECPEEAQKLMLSLLRIQMVINSVSRSGIEKLVENYRSVGKVDKAEQLTLSGKETFESISTIEAQLKEKLLKHRPEWVDSLALEKYTESIRELLAKGELYRSHLRSTTWDQAQGVKIADELLLDALNDLAKKSKPHKEALKMAANEINFPKKAEVIPAQDGRVQWVPKRASQVNGNAVLENGVNGTCENESANLRNLYFRVDRFKNLMISCGSFDTELKATQLAAVIAETWPLVSHNKDRWVIHQLNSFFYEEHLIHAIHAQKQSLGKQLPNKKVTFLHFNTAFNAATGWPFEDQRSMEMNFESLALLACYVHEDLLQNLSSTGPQWAISSEDFKKDFVTKFKLECDQITILTEEIKVFKETLEGNPETTLLINEFHSIEKEIKNPLLNEKEEDSLSEDESVEKINLSSPNPDLQTRLDKITASLPPTVKLIRQQLLEKQNALKNAFLVLGKTILVGIHQLEGYLQNGDNLYFQKNLLLLEVLGKILNLQLRLPSSSQLSRSTEMELFLLLYRLLDMKTILICSGGLDRSGAIRALSDASTELEWNFYQEILKKQTDPDTARISASRKIFELIVQCDMTRNDLFSLKKQLLDSDKIIRDLKKADLNQQGDLNSAFNIRKLLISQIDQEFSSDNDKKQLLKNTLYYLELVAKHLIGTELEKTLNSAGVTGLKYHFDAGRIMRVFANIHPLNRLPQFIFTEAGKSIQLLDFSSSKALSLTPAGQALILRLSQLRGA